MVLGLDLAPRIRHAARQLEDLMWTRMCSVRIECVLLRQLEDLMWTTPWYETFRMCSVRIECVLLVDT